MGIIQSMSRRGNCWDNAPQESFFGHMKDHLQLNDKDTFEEITGNTSNLVRLPYGSKPYTPEESYKKLIENDLLVWDWNLDTEDWKATTDNILSNILLHGRNKEDLVILMHEKEQTVDALELIIIVLKERGYRILPITEDKEAMNFWSKNL